MPDSRTGIQAGTVQGDIAVRSSSGQTVARSVEGRVTVDGAKGRIEARSVDGDVLLTGCAGDIVAESTDGNIRVTQCPATSLDVSTIDGDIIFDGAVARDGNVYLRVPEDTSATFAIRTYEGRFTSSYAAPLSGDYKRGRRVTFTLGAGGAAVEIEAFDGRIQILKPGEALPADVKR